jgi:hypothetical protein
MNVIRFPINYPITQLPNYPIPDYPNPFVFASRL